MGQKEPVVVNATELHHLGSNPRRLLSDSEKKLYPNLRKFLNGAGMRCRANIDVVRFTPDNDSTPEFLSDVDASNIYDGSISRGDSPDAPASTLYIVEDIDFAFIEFLLSSSGPPGDGSPRALGNADPRPSTSASSTASRLASGRRTEVLRLLDDYLEDLPTYNWNDVRPHLPGLPSLAGTDRAEVLSRTTPAVEPAGRERQQHHHLPNPAAAGLHRKRHVCFGVNGTREFDAAFSPSYDQLQDAATADGRSWRRPTSHGAVYPFDRTGERDGKTTRFAPLALTLYHWAAWFDSVDGVEEDDEGQEEREPRQLGGDLGESSSGIGGDGDNERRAPSTPQPPWRMGVILVDRVTSIPPGQLAAGLRPCTYRAIAGRGVPGEEVAAKTLRRRRSTADDEDDDGGGGAAEGPAWRGDDSMNSDAGDGGGVAGAPRGGADGEPEQQQPEPESYRRTLSLYMRHNANVVASGLGVPPQLAVVQDMYRITAAEWLVIDTYFKRDLNSIEWGIQGGRRVGHAVLEKPGGGGGEGDLTPTSVPPATGASTADDRTGRAVRHNRAILGVDDDPRQYDTMLRRLFAMRRRMVRYSALVQAQLDSCRVGGVPAWQDALEVVSSAGEAAEQPRPRSRRQGPFRPGSSSSSSRRTSATADAPPAPPSPSAALALSVGAAATADFEAVAAQVAASLSRLDQCIAHVGTQLRIMQGRLSLAEAERTARQNALLTALTVVATAFLPVTTVSAVLNMQGDWAPGAPKFPTFWAIALPVSGGLVLVLGLVRFWNDIESWWAGAGHRAKGWKKLGGVGRKGGVVRRVTGDSDLYRNSTV